MGPDQNHLRVFGVCSGLEPGIEAASRHSEQLQSAIAEAGSHTVFFIGDAVVIPTQTEVERQFVGHLPVVLEKEIELVLMNVANRLDFLERIVPQSRRELLRLVDEPPL